MNESVRKLLSPESGVPAQAAEALYLSADSRSALANEEAARALMASVERGNRTAPALLLLSFVPQSAALLRKLAAEHGAESVKLKSWSRVVPLSVVATVALSRLGDAKARLALLEQTAQYPDAVRVFLLDVLSEIDSPEVWHQLATYLHDETEIPEGVPSGAARRRVADHAVDALLDHFRFPVSFARNPGGRYSVEQIEETLRLFRQTVPR